MRPFHGNSIEPLEYWVIASVVIFERIAYKLRGVFL